MSSDNSLVENNTSHQINFLDIQALDNIRRELGIAKPIFYLFVDDEQILALNNQILNHDYYTDIITFDYEEDDDLEQNEIVICLDRVFENALINHVTKSHELHRVCVHGLLHISGLDDKTEEQKLKMRSEEERYIDLHVPRETIE